MLLSFRASNHRSLRDEQQLLLTPAYSSDNSLDGRPNAVPIAGIFGANASGKTNVIDALVYMRNLVRGSLRESEPGTGVERHPFALDADMSSESSVFVVDLLLEGVRFSYGFAVDDDQVVEEWMYSYPKKHKRTIFDRKLGEYAYGEHSPDSMRKVEEITDSNVLFLSVAARSRQSEVRPVYDWFVNLISRSAQGLSYAMMNSAAERVLNRPEYLGRITTLLRAADIGIEATELVEESDVEWARRNERLNQLSEGLKIPRRMELSFQHRGENGTFSLGFRDQSRGTRALFGLAIPALNALDRGSMLIVDELDSSLHTFLSAQLIALFRNPESNPYGAQLIFSSHDAALLGRIQGQEVLERNHIWFTEKSECGVTELFPLSEFHPRKDENRARRYLDGRYGAVPVVNDELFAAALAGREEVDDADPKT